MPDFGGETDAADGVPAGDRLSAIQTLYSAERSMGFALHASTLYTTIANLTYLGVALGLWFGRSSSETKLPNGSVELGLVHLPPILLLLLPIPAWGLASYHVIQFSMVTAHGHSIAILEKELIAAAKLTTKRDEIGSRAEELRTNVTFKNPVMVVVSILAYGVAFLGVLGFAVVCVMQIIDIKGGCSGWSLGAIVLNSFFACCVGIGFLSASTRLDRSAIWADEQQDPE